MALLSKETTNGQYVLIIDNHESLILNLISITNFTVNYYLIMKCTILMILAIDTQLKHSLGDLYS